MRLASPASSAEAAWKRNPEQEDAPMDRNDPNQTPRPDAEGQSLNQASTTGTDYSSRQTDPGTAGFTGGGNFNDREEFSGRPNVAEARQDLAADPGESTSEPVEREPLQGGTVERDALQNDQDGSDR
jgi:hypothetical protein